MQLHRATATERVSAIDNAWLRMDSDTNAMVITALLIFEDPPTFDDIRGIAAGRLLENPRFRERVVPDRVPLAAPIWQTDPSFELERHLRRSALPSPAGERELEAFVGDLLATPLPRDRPLWQIHYIENFAAGSALVARIHHAVGDGVALVNMLLGMTDQRDVRVAEVGVPIPHPTGAVATAREIATQAETLGRELVLPSDVKTPLRGALGHDKRAAYSAPVSLELVKAIAARAGAKLNDVLMAAIAGALRDYLIARGAAIDVPFIRAMVPIYVRPTGASPTAGNHFGLVFVPLAIGEADRQRRLLETQRQMKIIKRGREAVVALEVLAALGMVGPRIEGLAIDLFTRKASVMITNIPGPLSKLELAGKTISSFVVWAPVSGHLGMGLSLMTYGRELRMGVAADARLVPDPDSIARFFEREIQGFAHGNHH